MTDTDRAIAQIKAALDIVPARSWWSVPFGDHAKYIEACSPPNRRALLARLDAQDAEIERLRVAVEALAYSLRHMEHCVVCATDSWQECAGGRDALAALRLADEAMKERT